ncbi:TRAP transporter fused permease subunit [Mesorhizobium sp. Z1-4]|uniref:TRAP transporter permease n=1 Tax=Mesorhizobium sp. Z1-4 TaxID=2448478 RepID=UPI000FD79912|nr:TRAP transporter fused permease subunit [Mesorhizobium sp. Z1-4]
MLRRYYEGAQADRDQTFPREQRQPGGLLRPAVTVVCATLTCLTLYFAFTVAPDQIEARSLFLAFAIPLTLLLYPAWKSSHASNPSLLDWVLALAALAAFGWAYWSADGWLDRFVGYNQVPTTDFLMGIVALVTIFEATRRSVGSTIVVLNLVFIVYALTGPIWPGIFKHAGMSPERFIETMYMDAEGIFNFITGLVATFIFTFLMFGVFLRLSGGDRIFTNFAAAISGHRRGGPAKIAVISSALMGMLSGSSISNVSTTGTMTIPMMKKLGFRNYEAGAIEVVASVGGGLMPPLMGTGIFVMSSLTDIPLVEILFYSVAPALLYYAAIYFYVDIKAAERGMAGMPVDQLPKLGTVLAEGGHIFVPIFVLIALLLMNFTPFYASAACVVMTVVISYVRRSTWITPSKLLTGLEAAARVVLTIAALITSAAIIYAVIVHTGLLTKVTSILIGASGGNAIIAVVLIGLMSYVIGMGLPVTASYVIIAALGASALQHMGISVLAAHLIIFWFAQDSTITPPICMTAFVGARIADAPPMRTGWESMKIAKALYIIPFMFAFSSLIDPSIAEVVFDTVLALIMFYILPIVVGGYWRGPVSWLARTCLLISGGLLFWATVGPYASSLVMTGLALGATAASLALARAGSQTQGAKA